MASLTSALPTMPIGALSRLTGCNIETIRYYERAGLLPRPPRSAGGHRVYGAEHEKRLVFIRRSRELGFTLDEVRAMLRLADGGGYRCRQVRDIALGHLGEVRARIADLRQLERKLASIVAQCAGGVTPDCPILDALSRRPAAGRGTSGRAPRTGAARRTVPGR